VRDYTDWIWSAYNFWCNSKYEKKCNRFGRAVVPGVHLRTPDAFHDIVMGPLNGTDVESPLLFKNPCERAYNLFRFFINMLWKNIPIENTLIISSEELEKNPHIVWKKMADAIGIFLCLFFYFKRK
jgi:hypothetical protein